MPAPRTRTRPAAWSSAIGRRRPAGWLRFEPTRNKPASPYRYEIDPDDLLRLTIATDDADEVFWAIVHSHVRSPARPSPTDVGLAFYPDAMYLLVSLAEAEPSLGAFRIVDGSIHPVELPVGIVRAPEDDRAPSSPTATTGSPIATWNGARCDPRRRAGPPWIAPTR